jgi:hypothetical protein
VDTTPSADGGATDAGPPVDAGGGARTPYDVTASFHVVLVP